MTISYIFCIIKMVNDMKNNRLGFTLVELLATIVLLGIVTGITGYAITNLIKSSKEKDYELLVGEIKDAIEIYYEECKYSKTSSLDNCPSIESDGYYKITLGTLVEYGFLKGNATDNSNGNSTLVNPKDNENIASCEVEYKYNDGNMDISFISSSNISCPSN